MSSPTTTIVPIADGSLDPDPVTVFRDWIEDARNRGVHEPEAMTLATASSGGVPSARMVLLRGFGPDGFVFFTNYDSRKATDLADNPRAALVFHWATIGRQVRIEGLVGRTSEAESDAYFASRHPASQVGAWASPQSRAIPDRGFLEREVAALTERFSGRPVPRPPNWGGLRLTPTGFEFWQHADSRLHDRFRYDPQDTGWRVQRVAP